MNKGAFVEGFVSELEKIGMKIPKWFVPAGYGFGTGMMSAALLGSIMKLTRASNKALLLAKKKTGKKWDTYNLQKQKTLVNKYISQIYKSSI